MDHFFEQLASMLGGSIAAGHLKLVACIFATYPSAVFYRILLPRQQPIFKHLFSIAYVLFTMLCVLRFYTGFLHIALTCLITYVFMKYYRGDKGPWINLFIVMASMAICHIDRQIKGFEGDTELDYSGPLMVAVIKLSAFGFNIQDGRNNKKAVLTEHDQRMKIEKYPNLIEFFGWICFFGGFWAGPTCEYMDYIRYTHIYFSSPESKLSPFKPAMRVLLESLAYAIVLVFVAPTFNYFRALEPAFQRLPFYKKLLFFQVAGFATRCKYYCAWRLAEGSCILSGFGFNGFDKDGKARWNRLCNIDVPGLEKSQSMKEASVAWNIGVNNWLRHYIYFRITPPGTSATSLAALLTYTTSAVWHGFHPGYYLFFCSVALYQLLGRRIRRCIRPLTLTPTGEPLPFWKSLYDTAGWVLTIGIFNLLTSAFDLLYASRIHTLWRSVHYVHYWGLLIAWLAVLACEPTLRRIQKQRIERAKNEDSNNETVKDEEVVRRLNVKNQ